MKATCEELTGTLQGESNPSSQTNKWLCHVITGHWCSGLPGAAVWWWGFLPGFFGVRVKVPLTVRQWELSPPQTPHLSSTLLEPISLSQPTFWSGWQDTEEDVCICEISSFLNGWLGFVFFQGVILFSRLLLRGGNDNLATASFITSEQVLGCTAS